MFVNGVLVQSGGPVSGGTTNLVGTAGGFSWVFSASGVPLFASPTFTTTNISIIGVLGGTIAFFATQQGLTSPTDGLFSSTFAATTNGSIQSVSMENYINPSNSPFGTEIPLDIQTCGGTCAPPTVTTLLNNLTTPYSETEIFTIIYSSSGGVTGNSQITATVPEPATGCMMLLGFAGIGFVTYRRTKKNTTALAAT